MIFDIKGVQFEYKKSFWYQKLNLDIKLIPNYTMPMQPRYTGREGVWLALHSEITSPTCDMPYCTAPKLTYLSLHSKVQALSTSLWPMLKSDHCSTLQLLHC